MEEAKEWLGLLVQGKMALVALGIVCAGAVWWGKKAIPKLVAKLSEKTVLSWLDPKTDDLVERELIQDLVIAAVRLAEYKIPDKGLGQMRHDAVVADLKKVMPEAGAETLAKLIEIAVASSDAELKAISASALEKRKAQEIT